MRGWAATHILSRPVLQLSGDKSPARTACIPIARMQIATKLAVQNNCSALGSAASSRRTTLVEPMP